MTKDKDNNCWKISSKVKDKIRHSVNTTVNYLITFDSIENALRLQIRESVNRKYNLEKI
jgi:hypothetical protein